MINSIYVFLFNQFTITIICLRLQSVERQLDFGPTGAALSNLVHNTRMMLRFDAGNAFLQLAWEGVPGMHETEIDAKRDLDNVLKTACSSMKQSAIKTLLGPLDGFLAKVTAFIGDIPISDIPERRGSEGTLLQSSASGSLKSQAFIRTERVKEMLDSAMQSVVLNTPELRLTMQQYIENTVARAILLKPIQQEADVHRRKMETIIASCIDPGQPRRDIEQLLQSVFSIIITELTH